MREIRSAQYASYIVIASAAIGLLLVLYSLTDRLQTRIGALVLQTAAHGQFRRRVFKANGRVLEMNDRNLRRVGRELHAGPLQLPPWPCSNSTRCARRRLEAIQMAQKSELM